MKTELENELVAKSVNGMREFKEGLDIADKEILLNSKDMVAAVMTMCSMIKSYEKIKGIHTPHTVTFTALSSIFVNKILTNGRVPTEEELGKVCSDFLEGIIFGGNLYNTVKTFKEEKEQLNNTVGGIH